MQRILGKYGFEDQVFVSIFEHAKKLEGNTLAELADAMQMPTLVEMKGKGAAGQLIHACFGLHQNDNRAEADMQSVKFPDGRIGEVEIKVVPLMSKSRGLRVKERCKVTSIDYGELLAEKWGHSRARHKLLSVLFVFYRYSSASDWSSSSVEKVLHWAVDEASVKDTVRLDWQRTWDYVNDGRAHELSESQGNVLAACTSGAGHDSKHVTQPKNPSVLARKRSFALKPSFLQTTYEYTISPQKFESITTLRGKPLKSDIHTEILNGFAPFVGKTLGQMADRLGVSREKTKHASAILVRRALGILNDKKRLLELEVAGVKPKTIPVREGDLRPCEAMSFPAIRLAEFVEEDWEDSEFRSHLDCLLLIPTLAEHCKQELWSRQLARPFFWSPSEEEEAGIIAEWQMFQREVLAGKAAYKRIAGQRISKLTPGSKTKFIHMRPKGRDGSEDDVDPNGKPAQKLCFWLNQAFVQSLLVRHLR